MSRKKIKPFEIRYVIDLENGEGGVHKDDSLHQLADHGAIAGLEVIDDWIDTLFWHRAQLQAQLLGEDHARKGVAAGKTLRELADEILEAIAPYSTDFEVLIGSYDFGAGTDHFDTYMELPEHESDELDCILRPELRERKQATPAIEVLP